MLITLWNHSLSLLLCCCVVVIFTSSEKGTFFSNLVEPVEYYCHQCWNIQYDTWILLLAGINYFPSLIFLFIAVLHHPIFWNWRMSSFLSRNSFIFFSLADWWWYSFSFVFFSVLNVELWWLLNNWVLNSFLSINAFKIFCDIYSIIFFIKFCSIFSYFSMFLFRLS